MPKWKTWGANAGTRPAFSCARRPHAGATSHRGLLMSNERDSTTAPTGIPRGAAARGYHHGDLRNGLLQAARTILEEESLSALTLRAVARKAGVSHAAPYRHFSSHEALLVELSLEGFDELRLAIAEAAKAQGSEPDKIATIGA